MRIDIVDTEYVKCELDDTIPVLRHRWKKAPPDDVFKTGLITIAGHYRDLKKSYHNLAWLADTEQLGELSEDVEDWLVNVWEDLLFRQSGVKVHAVILGASIFADYPMEKFKMDAEEKFKAYNVHLGVFSHELEAYEWIRMHVNL